MNVILTAAFGSEELALVMIAYVAPALQIVLAVLAVPNDWGSVAGGFAAGHGAACTDEMQSGPAGKVAAPVAAVAMTAMDVGNEHVAAVVIAAIVIAEVFAVVAGVVGAAGEGSAADRHFAVAAAGVVDVAESL